MSPKVNFIVRLDIELTNYDITAKHVSRSTTGTQTNYMVLSN